LRSKLAVEHIVTNLLNSYNVASNWRSTVIKRNVPSKRDRVNVSISALEVHNTRWNTWQNGSIVYIRRNGHANHVLAYNSGVDTISRDHVELFAGKQGRRNSADAWAHISLNEVVVIVRDAGGLSAVLSYIFVLEDSLLEAIDVLELFILDGHSAASDRPECCIVGLLHPK